MLNNRQVPVFFFNLHGFLTCTHHRTSDLCKIIMYMNTSTIFWFSKCKEFFKRPRLFNCVSRKKKTKQNKTKHASTEINKEKTHRINTAKDL